MSHRVSQFHLSLLKSYLKRSTFDLFEAWKAIQLALLSELKSNQAKQQLWMPLELSGALYGIVWGWVSCEALRKVEEQWKLLAKTDPPPSLTWTGIFTWVYGLLCIYILNSFRGSLLLDHFHSNWHLIHDGALQLLLEPRQHIEPIQAQSSLLLNESLANLRLGHRLNKPLRVVNAIQLAISFKGMPFTLSRCIIVGTSLVN